MAESIEERRARKRKEFLANGPGEEDHIGRMLVNPGEREWGWTRLFKREIIVSRAGLAQIAAIMPELADKAASYALAHYASDSGFLTKMLAFTKSRAIRSEFGERLRGRKDLAIEGWILVADALGIGVEEFRSRFFEIFGSISLERRRAKLCQLFQEESNLERLVWYGQLLTRRSRFLGEPRVGDYFFLVRHVPKSCVSFRIKVLESIIEKWPETLSMKTRYIEKEYGDLSAHPVVRLMRRYLSQPR